MVLCPTDQSVIETSLYWDGIGSISTLFANQTFEFNFGVAGVPYSIYLDAATDTNRNDLDLSGGGNLMPSAEDWFPDSSSNTQNIDQTFDVLDLNEVRILYQNGTTGSPQESFQIKVLADGRVVFLVDDITAIEASTNQEMSSISFGSNLMLYRRVAFSADDFDDINFPADGMLLETGCNRSQPHMLRGGANLCGDLNRRITYKFFRTFDGDGGSFQTD